MLKEKEKLLENFK